MSYSVRRQGIQGVSVSEFEWTKDAPKVPGWYWTDGEPAIVLVEDRDGELMVITDDGGGVGLDYYSLWLGPLPEPFSPEKR